MQNSQEFNDLDQRIELVKWQQGYQKRKYDLTTIHSLLLDDNPKFIYLRGIIDSYNNETKPQRIRYRQVYVAQLFKMLSEVTRIDRVELQRDYLDKIYLWTQGKLDDRGELQEKQSRPGTATTRTRPTTAYSRPVTAKNQVSLPGTNRPQTGGRVRVDGLLYSRPQTGTLRAPTASNTDRGIDLEYGKSSQPTRNQQQFQQLFAKMSRNNPKIDYTKLAHGEHEFFCGLRTLHPELQPPKKRLKEYQRNRLYVEDEEDEDIQIVDLEEDKPQEKLAVLEVTEEKLIEDIEAARQEENGQNFEGEEGLPGQDGAEDVNIDDIPLEGDEGDNPNEPEQEEEPEVVDKLRPRLKAYGEPEPNSTKNKVPRKQYEEGIQKQRLQKEYEERKNDEDKVMAGLQAEWAQCKGRAKSEMKRRAESARVVGKKMGIPFEKFSKGVQKLQENVVHFENVVPAEVDAKYGKPSRPCSAFTSDPKRKREQLIKNAFLVGNLGAHILPLPQTGAKLEEVSKGVQQSLAVYGQKPKRKTFQQILHEAQDRVIQQSQQQIQNVKEAFSKNKISMGVNRIAKSITHYQREVDEWGGVVTGLTMLKNPFIKVAKKKKKKKKKA